MADFSDTPLGNVFQKGQTAAQTMMSNIKGAASTASNAVASAKDALSGSITSRLPDVTKQPAPNTGAGATPHEALTANVGWKDNVLNTLQQATYHVRFFMTEDTPITYNDLDSYDDLYNKILNLRQTTIAESGVTGINITSLTIETMAGPNPTYRSMAATNISFTIREPMGVGFMDLMAKSASDLRVNNFAKCFYYLEVSFMGYDDTGAFVHNPCAGFPGNKGKWLYQIGITNLDVEVDSTGGTYTLTAVPYEQRVLEDDHLHLPDMVSPEGKTVRDILDNLAKGLNDSIFKMYGFQPRKYEFRYSPLIINDQEYHLENELVTPEEKPELASKRSNSMEVLDGLVKAHFARGTTLDQIVDQVFANCAKAQMLAKDVLKTNDIKLAEKKFRESIIFKVQPTVLVKGYDFATEDYILEYTLNIKPYYTQKPIIEPNQIEISKDPAVQAENALKLRKNGYLVKRYDYIFTGLNTEVINLDMKFKLNWAAALPRVMGFRNSLESSTPQDKQNTKEYVQSEQTDLKGYSEARSKIRDDIDQNNSEIKKTKAKATLTESDTARINELNALNANLKEADSIYEKVQSEKIGKLAEVRSEVNKLGRLGVGEMTAERANTKVRYAEEIKQEHLQKERSNGMPPVSISQSSEDTRFITSGAFQDSYHRDRSIYGAVLDQVYGPMTTQMQNIQLEIKGDPYWLGMGNMERTWSIEHWSKKNQGDTLNKEQQQMYDLTAPVDDINRPDYSRGDILFLLSYRYPRGYNDDGSPDIKSNDFFTGVYAARKITHKFDGGQFTQTIDAFRMPLIDVFKAFGYRDEDMTKKQEENKQATIQARKDNLAKKEQERQGDQE